jgi:hypothetical protein
MARADCLVATRVFRSLQVRATTLGPDARRALLLWRRLRGSADVR